MGCFVDSIGAATRARQPSTSLGEDVRLRGERVVGSGLELDGLVDLADLSRLSTHAQREHVGGSSRGHRSGVANKDLQQVAAACRNAPAKAPGSRREQDRSLPLVAVGELNRLHRERESE